MTQVNKRKHAANKNKLLPRLGFHCQVANTCFVKNSPQEKHTFLWHQLLSFFLQNFAVELYTLYKEQDGDIDKLFTELTDDDVTEILLTVNATVIFNDKRNASTVIKL